MLPVLLLFMRFWTPPFWMFRFSKDALWACRLFLQTSSLVFSLFRNGLGDMLGDASGLHVCQLLAFCLGLSLARALPRPDLLLRVIVAGIHG